MKLILDTPEHQQEKAKFEFKKYSTALWGIIKDTDPHFTIGIFGEWGTGKTSLMRIMKNELDKDENIVTVWFNPWRFQEETNLLIPLLQTIKTKLERNEGAKKRRFKKVGDRLKKFITSWEFKRLNLGPMEVGKKKSAELNSVYYNAMEDLRDSLDEVRKENPKARLVIFIDDLDRVVPEKAIKVLESTKTFLDLDGFVFVLGLDSRTIEEAVEERYKEIELSGKEYLEKVVQVHFNLPHVREIDTIEYVKGLLKEHLEESSEEEHLKESSEEIESFAPIIADASKRNPRAVKRFINNFFLTLAIGKDVLNDQKMLLIIQVLQQRWKSFYDEIAWHDEKKKKERLRKYKDCIERYSEFEEKEGKVIPPAGIPMPPEADTEETERYIRCWKKLKENPEFRRFLETKGNYIFGKIDGDEFNYSPYFHFTTVVSTPAEEEKRKLTNEEIINLLRTDVDAFSEWRKRNPNVYVDLSGTDLRRAYLGGADLSKAYLSGTDLERANLSETNLMGTNFRGADLSETDLRGANLERANLERARLRGANLSYARFRGANLSYARLRGANLSEADLSETNLMGTNLSETDLRRANLEGADLTGVENWERVKDFTGTNLYHVRGLTKEQLNYALERGAVQKPPKEE